jgi:hypothetical protein
LKFFHYNGLDRLSEVVVERGVVDLGVKDVALKLRGRLET